MSGTHSRTEARFGIPFWVGAPLHFRTYVSGDSDVHWGYDLDFDPWPSWYQISMGLWALRFMPVEMESRPGSSTASSTWRGSPMEVSARNEQKEHGSSLARPRQVMAVISLWSGKQ